jgi:hypothetical protein
LLGCGTDQTGSPDVTFGFSSKGAKAFQHVTSTIAHRGERVSGLANTLNQHQRWRLTPN